MKLKDISKQELEKIYEECKTKKAMASFLNVNEKTVAIYLKKYNIEKCIGSQGARKHTYNESYFENIDCQEKAYWLGFLMADGCIYAGSDKYSYRLQINLKLSDKSHLELFQQTIGSSYKIQEKILKNAEICLLKVNSTKMCKDLIVQGVIPRKSLVCSKPNLPSELIPHFIRGYFDGDGCITCCNRERWSFSFTGGEDMLLFIQNELQCKTGLYKIKHSKALSLEAGSKESLIYFYEYIYSDATVYLNRKKEKYDDYYLNVPFGGNVI